MATAAAERGIVDALLVKLGMADKEASALPADRAVKKLTHRLTKNGIPAEVTADEAALIKSLGFTATVGEASAATKPGEVAMVVGKAAKKGTKAPAAAKKPAAAKAPKDAKAATPKAKKPGSGGMGIFRAAFEDKTVVVKKSKLLEKLVGAGVKPETASSYVVWAKHPVADKVRNPFGFRITEKKDDKGEKLLQRA